MAFNLMAGALSAVIMQSRGVERGKIVAGAALSALTPGLLGLAIPLALASQAPPASGGERPSGTDAGTGGATTTTTEGEVTVVFTMPDVVGSDVQSARRQLISLRQKVKVHAAVRPCDSEGTALPGTVLMQKPEAGRNVAEGDLAELFVQPLDPVATAA